MAQYIKLRSGQEFSISQDGLFIMSRHIPSGQEWTREYSIPGGKRVLDFRENRTGSQIQVLLSDNRWYESNMHGYLTLTDEEIQKDRQLAKAQKEEKKSKKSSKESIEDANFGIDDVDVYDDVYDDVDDDDDDEDDDSNRDYSSSERESEDDGLCKKLIFTIIPILPLWWVIKIPFSVISWPFRCLFSSKNKSLLPSYSFKKF